MITASLITRYKEEWDLLCKKSAPAPVNGQKPTNPLLLSVSSEYFKADCKIMIFGQETNDWESIFPHRDGVEHMLRTYEKFTANSKRRTGAFWNGISAFQTTIEKRSGKSVSLIWNNLIKLGKAGAANKPCQDILRWQDRWFDVVHFEVESLRPDIVIFFSGPNYDIHIERIFAGASFLPVGGRPARQLARVELPGLRSCAVRTYHPGHLYRVGLDDYLNDLSEVLDITVSK